MIMERLRMIRDDVSKNMREHVQTYLLFFNLAIVCVCLCLCLCVCVCLYVVVVVVVAQKLMEPIPVVTK